MHAYPETLAVLQKYSKQCHIAVASRTTFPKGADLALKLFGFDEYIDYREIYPGCKVAHFTSLCEKTGVNFEEMLFFDDEPRNIRDMTRAGVECVLVDEDIGVTLDLVDKATKRFSAISRF